MDLAKYSDEALLQAGREAVKREQWPRATELLSAWADRHTARGEATPASGLANYALCLAHVRELKLGLELACKAQRADPRNASIYWCMAQIHLLGKSRRDAIDTVERGLRAAPNNFLLLQMRKRLGVRQPPPLPFLDRRHALNVRLGRIMHKINGSAPSLLPA
jgi:hypothetical protein